MGLVYSTRDVAKLLKLPAHRVRMYAVAAALGEAGTGRPLWFEFRDLLVLRTAKRLEESGVRPAQIRRALGRLYMEADRPLSSLSLQCVGHRVIASDGETQWEANTGQMELDFKSPAPVWEPSVAEAIPAPHFDQISPFEDMGSARDWFDIAIRAEETEPERAYEAYLRTLACDPEHVEAMINIGRLCSAGGQRERAAAYFRQAIRVDPTQPVAHFNLGVTLHDLGDVHGAIVAYRTALIHDRHFADAHYNLSTLLEETGDKQGALKHMAAYQSVVRDPDLS